MAIKMAGNYPYAYIDLLLRYPVFYLSKKIGFKKGLWIGKKENSDKFFTCGEFVAYVLNKANNIMPNWYKTTPQMIADDDRGEIVYASH